MAPRSSRPSIIVTVKYTALALFALLWVILPLWLLVVNSFKPLSEAGSLSISLPQTWQIIENYTTVIERGNFLRGLGNSLVIAAPTIITVLLLGAAAAWAYARSKSTLLKVTYYVATLTLLLPPALLPTIFLLKNLGIDGTRIGYLLVTIGTRLGGMVFLTTGFIRSLPIDFEEAASIDGASKIQIFIRIILPLVAPILFVNAILLMIGVWNEFFFASFLMPRNELMTLPLALYRFSQTRATFSAQNWHLIFAHVVLTSLPLLLIYVFGQRRIISNLAASGVKG